MMSGDLQKSTENAEPNSENVSLLVYSTPNNYKKKEATHYWHHFYQMAKSVHFRRF